MRRYETFTILNPDLSDEERAPVLNRVKELIPQMDGFLILVDEWGARQLAYDIKKKSRGYYVRFDFCGAGELVNEMERFFRIDDRVMKYMTVMLDEQPDVEAIKEGMEKLEQEKAEKEKAQKEKAEKEKAQKEKIETKTEPADDSTEVEASESPESEETEVAKVEEVPDTAETKEEAQ